MRGSLPSQRWTTPHAEQPPEHDAADDANGRKRGTASALSRRIVARIQYTAASIPGTSRSGLRVLAKNHRRGADMGTTPRNEGEGNKTADRNYREATQKFVESERGRREIDKAGEVSAREEEEIRQAEEQAKRRAKEHDPAEESARTSQTASTQAEQGGRLTLERRFCCSAVWCARPSPSGSQRRTTK